MLFGWIYIVGNSRDNGDCGVYEDCRWGYEKSLFEFYINLRVICILLVI